MSWLRDKRDRVLWWIIEKCLFVIDHKNDLMTYALRKNKHTYYHILAERWLDDIKIHFYGTKCEPYPPGKNDEERKDKAVLK